jgi:hypothetical protein
MMDSEERDHIRFVEVQYFWQQPLSWLVWFVVSVMLYGMSSADLIEKSFAMSATVIVLAIMLLVLFTRLTTEISKEGISYRMWPFHKKPKLLAWSDIEHVEVKKYNPIKVYGGWGVRVGLNGRAYNIKGNMGLQIKLTSGKHILLGTQRADEIEEVLATLR